MKIISHFFEKIKNSRTHLVLAILFCSLLIACEDFLEIPPPTNQLTGELVFEDPATVEAAVINIYTQLRDNTLVTGDISGLPYLLGLYTDELILTGNNTSSRFFYENSLLASDTTISNIWDSSYNLIYASNAIIEGLENNTVLTEEEKSNFTGEAYFIRAFIHFYLVNVFGDIPYIKTSDYRVNSSVYKLNTDQVYEQIIEDLSLAKSLLPLAYTTPDRTRPNQAVASALLARTYLFNQDWTNALDESLELITNLDYTLTPDLNQVFLNTTKETLWQFDTGIPGFNTLDAQTYIFTSGPPPNCILSDALLNDFEPNDNRFTNWIAQVSDGTTVWHHAYKYKLNTTTGTTQECSIVMRLAELHLIAAESHAQLNNIPDALTQLNLIRERALLAPVTASNKTDVLNAIYKERHLEFFCEMAHRFFDLKRTGRLDTSLETIKPNWNTNNRLLPIPESELILNPNLEPQNLGY
ncbi:RagB/SusD family nutrient uptake outer membrane protein [Pseudotamlana agarivorans]|uniref:RagB/SusD family nutrient uptake outer membrane protein n=1 Tax=Pseudotamlana agarivorans TaxID=481183 RepID=UPI00082E2FE8|nr:RagB/SusD family nutrient uptake outer membrane protein [Tamlana agarivorans]